MSNELETLVLLQPRRVELTDESLEDGDSSVLSGNVGFASS